MKNFTQKIQLQSIYLFVRFLHHLSSSLATRFIGFLFFRPPKHKHPKWEQTFITQADLSMIKVNNKSIASYIWGNGEKSVLLVHGWGGRATQMSHFINPLVQEGYKVISFDGVAHGLSEGKETNMLEMSALIEHFLELHPEIETIIAHSFGGASSVLTIKRTQRPLPKIVVIGAPYSIDKIFKDYYRLFKLPDYYFSKLVRYTEKRLNNTFRAIDFDSYPPAENTELFVIHDKKDREVPVSEAEKYRQGFKKSETLITEGLGHRRILKDSMVHRKVLSFIHR